MSQKTIEKNESKQAMVRAKYVGQSPYKLRRIANIVRNKTYHEAMAILNNMPHNKRRKNPFPSRTSPIRSTKGCLCDDGTYKIECCDGTMFAQGIGKTEA